MFRHFSAEGSSALLGPRIVRRLSSLTFTFATTHMKPLNRIQRNLT